MSTLSYGPLATYDVTVSSVWPDTGEVDVTLGGYPPQRYSIAGAASALGWDEDTVIEAVDDKDERYTWSPPYDNSMHQRFIQHGESCLVDRKITPSI
jgi:hypothetical protein